jgi:hypothetical protein
MVKAGFRDGAAQTVPALVRGAVESHDVVELPPGSLAPTFGDHAGAPIPGRRADHSCI